MQKHKDCVLFRSYPGSNRGHWNQNPMCCHYTIQPDWLMTSAGLANFDKISASDACFMAFYIFPLLFVTV